MLVSVFYEHHPLVLTKGQCQLTAICRSFGAGQLIGEGCTICGGDGQDDLLCFAAVQGDDTELAGIGLAAEGVDVALCLERIDIAAREDILVRVADTDDFLVVGNEVFVLLAPRIGAAAIRVAAAVLTVLPELLREFQDYRMLVYAIVLILVMLITNNPQAKAVLHRITSKFSRKGKAEEGAGNE